MGVWVVVSDSRRARIFDAEKNGAVLSEIADFSNPGGHREEPEPARRSLDRRGGAWHGLAPRETPQEHDAVIFANDLSEYLYQEWAAHHFSDLVLIAGPEWLGHLRQALPQSVAATVGKTITKDLTRSSLEDLTEYVKAARPLVPESTMRH